MGFLEGPGIDFHNHAGIWAGATSDVSLVVQKGDAAPGIPGATLSPSQLVTFTDLGDLIFRAQLGGVDPEVNETIWAQRSGPLEILLREGDPAPGTPAGVVLGIGMLGSSPLTFSIPIAWLLARARFRGRGLLRTLITLPMVMPPVVAGVGLLAAFGRHGLLGDALHFFGVTLPFTTLAAVIAATFVSAPFLVTTLEAGLAQSQRRYEDVAATLGASRWRIFVSVVLPAIRPSLLAGIALCWARALGEFGATITFAGNLPARTQTVPLAIYQTLHTRPSEAFLMAMLLLIVSLCVLALVRVRGGAR